MKSKDSPKLKVTKKSLGTGEASQGNIKFNHRSYSGVMDNGALHRLSGGFGAFEKGAKVLSTGK
jgi:hypothetical protein